MKNCLSKLRNIETKFERVKTVLAEKCFNYLNVKARYYLGMAASLNPQLTSNSLATIMGLLLCAVVTEIYLPDLPDLPPDECLLLLPGKDTINSLVIDTATRNQFFNVNKMIDENSTIYVSADKGNKKGK